MTRNFTSYRIIYGDTDQMGVVYYANYLKWFEIGRTELLRQLGLPYSAIEANGLALPVTEVSCRYYRPSRYDQKITVETTATSLGAATLTFHYRVCQEEDGFLLASGWTRHACVDGEGRVTRLPSHLNDALEAALSPEPRKASSNTKPRLKTSHPKDPLVDQTRTVKS